MVWPLEIVPDIDLGEDHYLMFTRWAPDDLPANRQLFGYPLPNIDKYGATIRHYKPDGSMCEGCITFDGEWQRWNHARTAEWCRKHNRPVPLEAFWTVTVWDPLTLTPSLLCHCGDYGWIKQGRWVRA